MQWNYEPTALRVRDRLTVESGNTVKLIEGGGGVFEITRNNELVFSKKQLGRFPTDNEVDQLLSD